MKCSILYLIILSYHFPDSDSVLSILDYVNLDSELSIRSFIRFGSSLSIYGLSRFDSSLSVLDYFTIELNKLTYSRAF